MVTEEEARIRAHAWVGADGADVGMREFDQGWVVWAVRASAPDPTRPPERVGDSRGVVDRDTGELFVYPPMSVNDVARRHRWRRQAYERFPRDVADRLLSAGWHPDRRLPDAVLDAYADRMRALGDGPDRPGFVLHDAARAVLAEFGGLRVRTEDQELSVDRAGGFSSGPRVLTISFQPDDHRPDADLLEEMDIDLGLAVLPVGFVHPPKDEELVVDSLGRVFTAYGRANEKYLLADRFDDALVSLVRCSRGVDGAHYLVVPGERLAEVTFPKGSARLTGRYRDRSGGVAAGDPEG